jgi:hypothetical protein
MVKNIESNQSNQLPPDHRKCVGNDDANRVYSIVIPKTPPTLYTRLAWRRNAQTPEEFVGFNKLDLPSLFDNGYIREEPNVPNSYRVRFIHLDDDGIYIQKEQHGPRLRVGEYGEE